MGQLFYSFDDLLDLMRWCEVHKPIVRGSLTCRASVIGSLDATCHTGAARVSEPQNHAEQMLAAVFWVNMHSYSDLTLQGARVTRVWAHGDVTV